MSRVRWAAWEKMICAGILAWAIGVGWSVQTLQAQEPAASSIVLEDFQEVDANGFPRHWEAQRSKATAQEAYTVHREDGLAFLKAKGATQRIYTKRITWNPKTHPILTWRWRLVSVPEDAEFIAAVYPSLDTDLMFIPVNTKYLWSMKKPKGTITEGGLFRSTEIVIRSGAHPIGEWVEERVNVYEDFKSIHRHEPAPLAWGISLLGGPGVEIDFGPLIAHPE